jgi:hypothetical protein
MESARSHARSVGTRFADARSVVEMPSDVEAVLVLVSVCAFFMSFITIEQALLFAL